MKPKPFVGNLVVCQNRWPPRNVAIIGGLMNTVLIGIATVLLIFDGFNLIVFIVIAVLFGLFEAILYPAILALLPQLVRKSQLAEANAWIQGSEQFTEVIGPAGAGFMIGAFGLTIAFAINTLIFAFGSLFIYLVRTRRRQPLATEPEEQALTGEIVLGLKYAWTRPAIRISLLLIAMINFAMLGPIIIGVAALVNVKFFDINLDIQPGEIVIMTGPSGSGKTTLLTLMGGLRSAQEGSLKILGQEICKANKQQLTKLRRQIGYIFQAHNLMTFLTTQENVRMSLELHDEYLNHDINFSGKSRAKKHSAIASANIISAIL